MTPNRTHRPGPRRLDDPERRPEPSAPLPQLPPQSLGATGLRPAQRKQLAEELHRGAGNRAVGTVLQRATEAPTAAGTVPVQRGLWGALAGVGKSIAKAAKSVLGSISGLFKPGDADKTKMIQKAKAVKILEKAYGKYRKSISGGSVKLLSQAEFQKAYDAIYGDGEYSWDKYVVPKFGNLEGFAHKGINYINEAKGSVDVVPHEMLHNNTHASFTAAASGNINEGLTEYLTMKAVTAEGYTASHSYPNQEGVITKLKGVIGEEVLLNAYFKGEVEALKKAVNDKTKGGWDTFKKHMDDEDWTKAKAAVVAK